MPAQGFRFEFSERTRVFVYLLSENDHVINGLMPLRDVYYQE